MKSKPSRDLTKTIILYFRSSKTYELFVAFNQFFREILKAKNTSCTINFLKKLGKQITLKDVGVFVILTVLFNTAARFALNGTFDIFSISSRIFFLFLGLVLFFSRKQK